MKTLINISHQSSDWWEDYERRGWDAIIDIPVPEVDAYATEADVSTMSQEFFDSIIKRLYADYRVKKAGWTCEQPERNRKIIKKLLSSVAFRVTGDWSFFYAFVTLIKSYGGECVCACFERRQTETSSSTYPGLMIKGESKVFTKWRRI
jgi:hypothetical protein